MKQICIKYKVDNVQTFNFVNLVENYNDIVNLYYTAPTEKLLSLSLRYHKQINDQINNFISNYNKYYRVFGNVEPSPLELIKKGIENQTPLELIKKKIENRNNEND